MKKLGRLLLVALLITGLVAVAGCGDKQESDQKKLVVGTEATFPPFETVDEKSGDYTGFDIDLINAIGKEMGYEIEIMHMGFEALIPALKTDQVDCTISAQSITEKRLESIDFTDSYFDAGLIVAVPEANTDVTSYEDLGGKVLAAQIGTTGASWAQEMKEKNPKTEVKIFDGIGEAFMELEKGGADAVINDFAVTDYYIKTAGQGKVKMVGEMFSADEQYGIGVKKGNTEVLELLNEGLQKIKDNGKYDEVYQKWFG